MNNKKLKYICIILFIFPFLSKNVAKSFACCDAEPKYEILVESPEKKYAAVLVPNYFIRSINNIPIEFYNNNKKISIFLARHGSDNEPYKSIRQLEIEDQGSDFYSIFVSDFGSIVILSESINQLSEGILLRIINRHGKIVKSYLKNEIEILVGNDWKMINLDEVSGYFQSDILVLIYKGKVVRIDCQVGKVDVF